jgi:hypothetical protein
MPGIRRLARSPSNSFSRSQRLSILVRLKSRSLNASQPRRRVSVSARRLPRVTIRAANTAVYTSCRGRPFRDRLRRLHAYAVSPVANNRCSGTHRQIGVHVIYLSALGGIKCAYCSIRSGPPAIPWSVSIVSVVLSGPFEHDARHKLAESRALVPLAPARRHRLLFSLAFTGRLRSAGRAAPPCHNGCHTRATFLQPMMRTRAILKEVVRVHSR